MNSVYDIAFDYIRLNNLNIDSSEKRDIINSISEVLRNGANSEDIYRKINKVKNTGQKHSDYFKGIKSNGSNLLKMTPKKIYYHNELRIIPKAPSFYFDLDSGEIKKEQSDYFLEMRASYTIDDLFNYVSKKQYFSKVVSNKSRVLGSLKYLIGKYDIDFLLFIIDTANEIYSTKLNYIRNILDITDYELEAKKNYERRVTECAISGTDKVVYKKRVLGLCAA